MRKIFVDPIMLNCHYCSCENLLKPITGNNWERFIVIISNLLQIKTEIKDEALDFSNTTLSENHHSDSSGSALSTNNIGEETRMYLDAFARSANLSWQQTAEDTTVSLLLVTVNLS